ncbi:hypothetical protein [Sodalis sp.]|uniref:hypothetical protein n=1 Tax=Sodalis sp. (in: enterobacteria) TaxID=1898979 RepID=UPI0038732683
MPLNREIHGGQTNADRRARQGTQAIAAVQHRHHRAVKQPLHGRPFDVVATSALPIPTPIKNSPAATSTDC